MNIQIELPKAIAALSGENCAVFVAFDEMDASPKVFFWGIEESPEKDGRWLVMEWHDESWGCNTDAETRNGAIDFVQAWMRQYNPSMHAVHFPTAV